MAAPAVPETPLAVAVVASFIAEDTAFAASASASQSVNALGSYSWTSSQMISDVQNWLDNPATNYGWILLGNESVGQTAKQFASA